MNNFIFDLLSEIKGLIEGIFFIINDILLSLIQIIFFHMK